LSRISHTLTSSIFGENIPAGEIFPVLEASTEHTRISSVLAFILTLNGSPSILLSHQKGILLT
ncbi:MAG: hypothetical protein KAR43_02075, partial [Deltaproteobacteria bacterium]|nr:hypothetical protein [Deltaproteobacteria bacterium]